MQNMTTLVNTTNSPKLRTQHIRVRITESDLKSFTQQERSEGSNHRETHAPLCKAINRTLADGFMATFDGLSIGVVKKNENVDFASPPGLLFKEYDSSGTAHWYNRVTDGDGEPFFRGVAPTISKHHQRIVAHRKVKPLRATVSLPAYVLKRNENPII